MATSKPPKKEEICKHGHNGSLPYSDNFTQSALADKLTFMLSSKLDCNVFVDEEDGSTYLHIFRPYLNQAEGLLYCINVYEHPPEFVIWEQDIPQPLRNALINLGIFAMKRIITEAIRRLFESVDINYFHTNSIYRKVRWRIAKG